MLLETLLRIDHEHSKEATQSCYHFESFDENHVWFVVLVDIKENGALLLQVALIFVSASSSQIVSIILCVIRCTIRNIGIFAKRLDSQCISEIRISSQYIELVREIVAEL